MGRCTIQLVTGPAGSGKSTYCHAIQEHCLSVGPRLRRRVHVANLDPAAESFRYDLAFDVRELISVDDVMDELQLGPNGSLIYCMEYLLENMDWLEDELDQFGDDEYLVLDCPGQVELYTHIPVMSKIIDRLRTWGYGPSMVSVFVVDATFVTDASKFISGSMLALSAMVSMQLPHINILSKCDLVDVASTDKMLDMESATQLWDELGDGPSSSGSRDLGQMSNNGNNDGDDTSSSNTPLTALQQRTQRRRQGRDRLTQAICSLLDDYSMVGFVPLNITDEDSVAHVLATVDHAVQYGEDLEVRGTDFEDSAGELSEE